jgi:bifunctional oligoribonuclease and PAP phosphatase NrnA
MTPVPSEVVDWIRQSKRIGLCSHIRPDGDALGSLLALGLSLQALGKEVTLLNEDGMPQHLAFLPESQLVQRPGADPLPLDLAIVLDTASQDRMGAACTHALSAAPMLINIDHHGSNPGYAPLNWIDSSVPAVGQMVYDLIQEGCFPFTDAIRQCIYVAINTDTGCFQYRNVNAHTHQIVAEMLAAGLDTARLCQLLYARNPLRKVRLLRQLLNEMEISADGQIASWCFSQAAKQALGVQPGDKEGLIDHLRSVEGVISAVIFEEQRDGAVRVSARSQTQSVDVARICGLYGGGGHRAAAGATMPGPLAQAAQLFLTELENEIRRNA